MAGLSEAPFTLAVTITFRQWDRLRSQALTEEIAKETIKQLIGRINREIFGHLANRQGHTISSAAVVGTNTTGGHIHAHLALAKPDHMSDEAFLALIEKIIIRFDWVDTQCDIQAYRDKTWLSYMVGHGTDSLALECFNKAKP